MRNEGNPLADIAIAGWGMAILLVVMAVVMVLLFRSMMKRMRAERERLEDEAEEGARRDTPERSDD